MQESEPRKNADAGIIYWADVFMGFTTGFVVIWNLRRRVIRQPRAVAEFYIRYGTFWPDFLSSLPTIAEVCISSPVHQTDAAPAGMDPASVDTGVQGNVLKAAGYLQCYQKLRE